MDQIIARLGTLPKGVLLAAAIIACIQLVLQVYALIDLSRRDSVMGGRKWVWVAIIIIGSLLGAIIYLGMGRVVYQPTGDDDPAGSEKATRRAIDNLYGDRK